MSESIFGIPFITDPSIPPGMARIGGRLHRLEGRNTAGWTAGAVAYGGQDAAECGLKREPARDHVWLIDLPAAGGMVRVSAWATAVRWSVPDPAMETVAPGWRAAQARLTRELAESARRRIVGTRPSSIIVTGI